MATLPAAETDFKFDSHFLPFLQNVPFFAELSRHLRKTPTEAIPTAGVTYDPTTDDIVLYWNPGFMRGIEARPNGDAEIHGLLTHEFYHLVFRHLASRRKQPHGLWNVATDAAINSLIMYAEDGTLSRTGALPPGGIVPGRPCLKPDGREMTKEEKTAAPLASLIEKWPPLKASEWYFMELQKWAKEQEENCPVHGQKGQKKQQAGGAGSNKGDGRGKKDKGDGGSSGTQPGGQGDGGSEGEGGDQPGEGHGGGQGDCTCGKGEGAGGLGPMDSHDIWDDTGEASREYIDARLSDLVAKAVKHADRQSNGWGNMPANLRAEIRASVEHEVDWRAELRNWVGTLCRGERTTSIKRINKRYPYMFPGTKRTYRPKLLVVGDQSGSVGDDAWELFFGEMAALTRHIDIDVVYFDTRCTEDDVFSWKKGRPLPPRARREKCGGTDFEAPTKFVNDPRNRGRWDGVVFMTDGECSKPSATRLKRLWVICPGRKLLFDTSDRVINLKKEAPKRGAWR